MKIIKMAISFLAVVFVATHAFAWHPSSNIPSHCSSTDSVCPVSVKVNDNGNWFTVTNFEKTGSKNHFICEDVSMWLGNADAGRVDGRYNSTSKDDYYWMWYDNQCDDLGACPSPPNDYTSGVTSSGGEYYRYIFTGPSRWDPVWVEGKYVWGRSYSAWNDDYWFYKNQKIFAAYSPSDTLAETVWAPYHSSDICD
ncbi:MAG: hypothetical protein GY847_33540 [Proteobacteria bacterium]|nr:hypothetical protein [Pseudomonadota bacterium]